MAEKEFQRIMDERSEYHEETFNAYRISRELLESLQKCLKRAPVGPAMEYVQIFSEVFKIRDKLKHLSN